MTDTRKALEMAIEKWQWIFESERTQNHAETIYWLHQYKLAFANISSLVKEALEQPAQEPVAWMNINGKVRLDYKTEIIKSIAYKNKVKEIPLYTHPAPQPAQEPVAWMHETYTDGQKLLEVWCDTQEHKADDTITIPLYTHPHQWQGLTDDERHEVIVKHVAVDCTCDPYEFARAIEQALKEKNHD